MNKSNKNGYCIDEHYIIIVFYLTEKIQRYIIKYEQVFGGACG